MLSVSNGGKCTHVVIDAGQLTQNIRLIQAVAERPVLAAVKANGYGHGYEIAARAFLKGGAAYLGVARVEEGELLRRAGITAPILVIGALLPEDIVTAVRAGLDVTMWNAAHIGVLRAMGSAGATARVHLKVDTGMGRLGCLPQDAVAMAQALSGVKGVEFVGLSTHFSSADNPDVSVTHQQIDVFNGVIAALAQAGIRPRIVHAANSAGTFYHPAAKYDMARVGISAYGEPPDYGRELPQGVKPALTWRTYIADTKILPAGHGVSYDGMYKTTVPQRVGIIPVGYGDGYRRLLDVNTVLVDGQERKILGRVCMDHCVVDLDGGGDMIGAEVILLGQQRGRTLSATELGRRWGTISYDVFTGIAARVPRHVVG